MTNIDFTMPVNGRATYIIASAVIFGKITSSQSDEFNFEGVKIEAFDFETNAPIELDDKIIDAAETKLLTAYLQRFD